MQGMWLQNLEKNYGPYFCSYKCQAAHNFVMPPVPGFMHDSKGLDEGRTFRNCLQRYTTQTFTLVEVCNVCKQTYDSNTGWGPDCCSRGCATSQNFMDSDEECEESEDLHLQSHAAVQNSSDQDINQFLECICIVCSYEGDNTGWGPDYCSRGCATSHNFRNSDEEYTCD